MNDKRMIIAMFFAEVLIVGFGGWLVGTVTTADIYQRQAIHHGYGEFDQDNKFQWNKASDQ